VISNISRLLVTGLTFILLLVISLFFHDLNEYQSLLNKESILLTFVFGVFVIYIPAILGMVASGSMATTKFNYLGWFIAPIVATFSLWIFEFGEINSTLIISLLLVLIPNILLNLEIGESFSFKVTFIWILFSSILLFYYEGISVDSSTYFSISNTLLVFFALTIGYLKAKIDKSNNYRDQLFMSFLKSLKNSNELHKNLIHGAIKELSSAFQQSNSHISESVTKVINKYKINTNQYTELQDFNFISLRKRFSTGELFVLTLTSILLLLITILYKQNNFLYDVYAFIISVSVVFTLSQVIEMSFFGEYSKKSQTGKQIHNNLIVIGVLLVLMITIILLFLAKHNFIITTIT